MEYSDKVQGLQGILEKHAQVGEHGTTTFDKAAQDELFQAGNVTEDEYKRVNDFTADLISGVGAATANQGLSRLKDDKKLDHVSAELKIGRTTYGAVFHRERNLPDGSGSMKPRTGVLSVNYKTYGQKGSSGQLAKVRKHFASEAAKVLGQPKTAA